jgi:hypothetical protein
MRRLGVVFLVFLGACGPPDERAAIERCERAIEGRVASPSTIEYVRGRQAVAGENEGEYVVIADFDAANAFGTPVRHAAFCFARRTEDGTWVVDSMDVR